MISARSMVDWRRGARHSKWKKMYDSFDYIRSVLPSYPSIHRPPINREAIYRKALKGRETDSGQTLLSPKARLQSRQNI